MTDETAVAYAALRVALKRSGRPIPANDAWIAALALQHRLPVLSRDEHFDAVPGLERERLVAPRRLSRGPSPQILAIQTCASARGSAGGPIGRRLDVVRLGRWPRAGARDRLGQRPSRRTHELQILLWGWGGRHPHDCVIAIGRNDGPRVATETLGVLSRLNGTNAPPDLLSKHGDPAIRGSRAPAHGWRPAAVRPAPRSRRGGAELAS